ncbi:hypothetical protein GALL_417630 [mine drainage metagenome]|uniref:Uncharacterized protein n=1 Tax=mine drainage metagenome TaxID=410659 RepID=A0A1J5PZQ5_9ZZZZ
MNKLLTTLAGVLTLGITLPATAGPDFQTMYQIEQTQKARQAEAATEKACESGRLVLPLDHGPHATSTPYLNQLRKERFEAEMKACKEAAATKR